MVVTGISSDTVEISIISVIIVSGVILDSSINVTFSCVRVLSSFSVSCPVRFPCCVVETVTFSANTDMSVETGSVLSPAKSLPVSFSELSRHGQVHSQTPPHNGKAVVVGKGVMVVVVGGSDDGGSCLETGT
jgi:hypothetical protein